MGSFLCIRSGSLESSLVWQVFIFILAILVCHVFQESTSCLVAFGQNHLLQTRHAVTSVLFTTLLLCLLHFLFLNLSLSSLVIEDDDSGLRSLEQRCLLDVTAGDCTFVELDESRQVFILRAHDALQNGRNITFHLLIERNKVFLLFLRIFVALSEATEILLGYLRVHRSIVLVSIDPLSGVKIVFTIIAILVVAFAFVCIGEHLISFAEFLEILCGLGVVWILVRVLQQRKLAIGFLDLILSSCRSYTEDLIQDFSTCLTELFTVSCFNHLKI